MNTIDFERTALFLMKIDISMVGEGIITPRAYELEQQVNQVTSCCLVLLYNRVIANLLMHFACYFVMHELANASSMQLEFVCASNFINDSPSLLVQFKLLLLDAESFAGVRKL